MSTLYAARIKTYYYSHAVPSTMLQMSKAMLVVAAGLNLLVFRP